MKGIITWFSEDKGFGFITPDIEGRDLIVQRPNVQTKDHEIYEGQRVEFEQIRGPRGPEAINVREAD